MIVRYSSPDFASNITQNWAIELTSISPEIIRFSMISGRTEVYNSLKFIY